MSIYKALLNNLIDPENTQGTEDQIQIEALRYAISRQMTCPVSGLILDYRHDYMVQIEIDGKIESTRCFSASTIKACARKMIKTCKKKFPNAVMKFYCYKDLNKSINPNLHEKPEKANPDQLEMF